MRGRLLTPSSTPSAWLVHVAGNTARAALCTVPALKLVAESEIDTVPNGSLCPDCRQVLDQRARRTRDAMHSTMEIVDEIRRRRLVTSGER